MKQKTKNIIGLSAFLLGLFGTTYAAYPTSYWQIGQANEVLEFNYGDENIASNVMAVYPDGSVVVNTYAPSDGTGSGGQALDLDIGGDLGAEYYCDENGENCFRTIDLLNEGVVIINDNSEWPEDTYDGDKVFNRDCNCIQVYDDSSDSWEPTYTENMGFFDREFPLPLAESGDVVFNLDLEGHCCYDGTQWELCDGSGACSASGSGGLGSFDFSCSSNPVSGTAFKQGVQQSGFITVPISNPVAGKVTLVVNEDEFSITQHILLDGTETELMLYPLEYYGGGDLGTQTFEIASAQGSGSCTGEAVVSLPGASFDFYCPVDVESPVDYIVGTPSSGFINIQVLNATAGTATILVEGEEFTAEEEVTFTGGETGIFIDINYNGTGTAGVKNFSISSAEGNGSCVGSATVTDLGNNAFTCTTVGGTSNTFIAGVPSTGGINLPITNAVAGAAVTLEIDQDGFTKTHRTVLSNSSQTAIFIPGIAYDGTGTAGSKTLSITSDQATNTCSAQVEVLPEDDDSFTCTTVGGAVEDFIIGTPSSGGINLPITNAVGGETVVLEIDQDGFTKTHITTLTTGDTAIFIPSVAYDGSGTSGTKTLSITSEQATNACSAQVTVTDEPGEFDFACTANATATGEFQFGIPGTGTLEIPITVNQPGVVTLNVDHNGFQASQNFTLDGTETAILINPLDYDGSSGPGTVQFGINSEHADSGCVGEAEVVPPNECPAGARVFSGIRPDTELYELPASIENSDVTPDVDSKNYTDATGPIVLTGVTGNCTADLTCVNGETAISMGTETCRACPAGTINGKAGAALVGINATYDYDAFDVSATQNVVDVVPQKEHGIEGVADMTCTATVTCDATDTVSLSNEFCEIECAPGYAKNNEGVCVEAACDIRTVIAGPNSGFGYNVQALIPVGGSQTFNGPAVRDNVCQCINRYELTVDCTAPNTWNWSENDPDCCDDNNNWGPAGWGPGGGGRDDDCAKTPGNTLECADYGSFNLGGSWRGQPPTWHGTERTRTKAVKDGGCSKCNTTDNTACDCSVTFKCNNPPNQSDQQGDETCDPWCPADTTPSNVDGECIISYDALGESEQTFECTLSQGDKSVRCQEDLYCFGRSPMAKPGTEQCFCTGTTAEGSECSDYSPSGETEYGSDQTGLTCSKEISNGTANYTGDATCSNGTYSVSNEQCDSVSCDDGYVDDGDCGCEEEPSSPGGGSNTGTNATAFFDGPKIKNITDFLVQLFK